MTDLGMPDTRSTHSDDNQCRRSNDRARSVRQRHRDGLDNPDRIQPGTAPICGVLDRLTVGTRCDFQQESARLVGCVARSPSADHRVPQICAPHVEDSTTARQRRIVDGGQETLMDASRRDALLKEYSEVGANFRLLTDIRFKLLGILPIAAAIAAALKGNALGIQGLGLSLFGLVATLGLATYNARNDQLYDELVGRAASIERSLGLPDGYFANRPRPWLDVTCHSASSVGPLITEPVSLPSMRLRSRCGSTAFSHQLWSLGGAHICSWVCRISRLRARLSG
jgi:hypothetical protein